MVISGIGQYLPATSTQSGKNVASPAANSIDISKEDQQSAPQKVDMRNISLNEVNKLIRAGVEGLLDVMPWSGIDLDKFKNDIDGSYRRQLADTKMDFIEQIEGSIAFEKSRGQSTDFLDTVLANLNRINGMEFPPKIDTIA